MEPKGSVTSLLPLSVILWEAPAVYTCFILGIKLGPVGVTQRHLAKLFSYCSRDSLMSPRCNTTEGEEESQRNEHDQASMLGSALEALPAFAPLIIQWSPKKNRDPISQTGDLRLRTLKGLVLSLTAPDWVSPKRCALSRTVHCLLESTRGLCPQPWRVASPQLWVTMPIVALREGGMSISTLLTRGCPPVVSQLFQTPQLQDQLLKLSLLCSSFKTFVTT